MQQTIRGGGVLGPYLLVSGLALAAVGLDAGPSVAKILGLHRLIIRGPGLEGSLVVTQGQLGMPRSPEDPREIMTSGLLGRYPKSLDRPDGALGPRFELIYQFGNFVKGEPRAFRLREFLYPYAEGGPVGFTPRGQKYEIGGVVPRRWLPIGWRPYPAEIVRILRAHGLPARPTRGPEPGADQPSAWVWLVPPVLVSLTILAARSRLRRSVARAT